MMEVFRERCGGPVQYWEWFLELSPARKPQERNNNYWDKVQQDFNRVAETVGCNVGLSDRPKFKLIFLYPRIKQFQESQLCILITKSPSFPFFVEHSVYKMCTYKCNFLLGSAIVLSIMGLRVFHKCKCKLPAVMVPYFFEIFLAISQEVWLISSH